MKKQELHKQTEPFNVSEQNPTRKRTEAVNVNEHILLKHLQEGEFIKMGQLFPVIYYI